MSGLYADQGQFDRHECSAGSDVGPWFNGRSCAKPLDQAVVVVTRVAARDHAA